jgi:hypothetical protein
MAVQGMTDWLAFLRAADIPVLKHTSRALERLRADEALLGPRSVADVVTDDPLMTVRLLRYMQSHKHPYQTYELVDVRQTLLMLGLDTFFAELPATTLVEDMLHDHGDALLQLLHTARRAQRAASYAFDWALRLHDLHAEEVRVSALLAHAAEMLMWCFDPASMLDIMKRQAAAPALRSADVQREVLGFATRDLQRQLVVEWRLPELLLTLHDPQQAALPRVRNVRLAVDLARHSAHGWDNPALPDDYRAIGELLHLRPAAAAALLHALPAA